MDDIQEKEWKEKGEREERNSGARVNESSYGKILTNRFFIIFLLF